MVPFKDFPDIVGSVEIDPGIAWDFKLPAGVTLTGTPVVTVQNKQYSTMTDPAPQSRIQNVQIGTVSAANCAVIAKFGPGIAGADYLFIVSCARSDGGVAACFNHIYSTAPA